MRGANRTVQGTMIEKRGSCQLKVSFFGFQHLILREYGRDGFCGYRPPHQLGEFPAIVNMGNLETDNKPEAEAGDAD
jgi:hypothetical protein